MNNISETAPSEILVRWSTKMPRGLVLWLCRKHYIAIILTSVCRKILIHLFHFYCLCLLLDRLLMASNIPSSAVIRPIVSPVKVFALSWLQRNCSVSSISLYFLGRPSRQGRLFFLSAPDIFLTFRLFYPPKEEGCYDLLACYRKDV